MLECKKISPIFNRMVIFSTTDFSYHGNPDKINCPENQPKIDSYVLLFKW